jgi:predicted MFS family arabinose efflux permease
VVNAALLNRLLERVPEDDRPAHMALHNIALNLGILGGSLLGPLLGSWAGLRPTLLLAAGLRVISGIVFALLA